MINCPNYVEVSKYISKCKVLVELGVEFIPSPRRSGGICERCIAVQQSVPDKDNLTEPMKLILGKPTKVELPTIAEQTASFIKSITKWVFSGFKNVPESERKRRISLCMANTCGLYEKDTDTCSACGCVCSVKSSFSHEECAAGLWGKKDLGAEVLNNAPRGCTSCGS